MTTLQITNDSPEAQAFLEYARKLPFVKEKAPRRKAALAEEEIQPMTMEEYNKEIDEAEDDYRAGRYITHEEMGKRIASW